MNLQDEATRSIAKAAQEVLEGYGKKKMKKEEMDPRDHVKENDGVFEVVDKDGKTVKTYKSKSAAEKYAVKNHDKLMGEVAEPEDKGHKKFKAMHTVKKSGEEADGNVVKEEDEVEEAYSNRVKLKGFDKNKKKRYKPNPNKYKLDGSDKVKLKGFGGKKLPKGFEEVEVDEESDKQKKYKAFFAKALKKFGVDSPAELKGDKKKEFFDYVDKNYEADNESD